MENKTKQITESLEKVLGQVETVVAGLHGTITCIKFEESLSDDDIEKLRLHLGYTKNYSDLAKTRLIYSRINDYEEQGLRLTALTADITSPAVSITAKGEGGFRKGGIKTPKSTRKTPLKD